MISTSLLYDLLKNILNNPNHVEYNSVVVFFESCYIGDYFYFLERYYALKEMPSPNWEYHLYKKFCLPSENEEGLLNLPCELRIIGEESDYGVLLRKVVKLVEDDITSQYEVMRFLSELDGAPEEESSSKLYVSSSENPRRSKKMEKIRKTSLDVTALSRKSVKLANDLKSDSSGSPMSTDKKRGVSVKIRKSTTTLDQIDIQDIDGLKENAAITKDSDDNSRNNKGSPTLNTGPTETILTRNRELDRSKLGEYYPTKFKWLFRKKYSFYLDLFMHWVRVNHPEVTKDMINTRSKEAEEIYRLFIEENS